MDSRVEREARWLLSQLLGDDPRMALACHRVLVERHLPWLQRRAIRLGRNARWSWAEIGRVLGVSRQAAQQRFGSTDLGHELPPSVPGVTMTAAHPDRQLERLIRDIERRREIESIDEAVPW